MGGTAVLSGDNVHIYYEAASKLRANLSREFNEAFKEHCDVLLLPTVISSPPKLSDSVSLRIFILNLYDQHNRYIYVSLDTFNRDDWE